MKRWFCLLVVLCLMAAPTLAQEYNLNGTDFKTDLGHNMDEFQNVINLLSSYASLTIQWGEAIDAENDFALVNATSTGTDKMQFLYSKATGKMHAIHLLLEGNYSDISEELYNASVVLGQNMGNVLSASLLMDVNYDDNAFLEKLSVLQAEQNNVISAFSSFLVNQSEMKNGSLKNISVNGRVLTLFASLQDNDFSLHLIYHASEDDTISVP